MTAHDPIKAAAEELSGLHDTFKTVAGLVRTAERVATEAEVQLNGLLKVRALVGSMVDDQTARLQVLREAAEREAKGEK